MFTARKRASRLLRVDGRTERVERPVEVEERAGFVELPRRRADGVLDVADDQNVVGGAEDLVDAAVEMRQRAGDGGDPAARALRKRLHLLRTARHGAQLGEGALLGAEDREAEAACLEHRREATG